MSEIEKVGRRNSQKDIDTMKQAIALLQQLIGDSEQALEEQPEKTEKRAAINKSTKLIDTIMLVDNAFQEQFRLREELTMENEPAEYMEQESPSRYWLYVYEVWDDFVIACLGTPDGMTYYQVNYSLSGDVVTFDGVGLWQEVELAWQPKIAKKAVVEIGKADVEKRLVYGIVLKPEPFVDSQGDIMTKDEIEVAAHKFMEKSRMYDLFHVKDLSKQSVVPVESYIAPQDLMWGEKSVPAGSWIVVSHVADTNIWDKIKKGEINAYSIRGIGYRKEIE